MSFDELAEYKKGRVVNSGLRLDYAHFPDQQKITFVELYY